MTHMADRQIPTLQTIREVRPHTFIFEQAGALPLDVCQEMIRRFEASSEEQYPGRIGQTIQEDQSIKRSTDLVVSGKAHWKDIDGELFRSLGRAIHEFRETFPFFKGQGFDVGAFGAALEQNARDREKLVVLLNFPNNPTGYMPTDAEGDGIVEALVARAEAGTRGFRCDPFSGRQTESDSKVCRRRAGCQPGVPGRAILKPLGRVFCAVTTFETWSSSRTSIMARQPSSIACCVRAASFVMRN